MLDIGNFFGLFSKSYKCKFFIAIIHWEYLQYFIWDSIKLCSFIDIISAFGEFIVP